MYEFFRSFLQKKGIDTMASVSLSDCRLLRPHLLERAGIAEGSVLIFAVPYHTEETSRAERNISAYAVAKDYHLFFSKLFAELIPALTEKFPHCRAVGFTDHSPIDEVHAAAMGGIGVVGQNGLLITPRHSSYVFLGEVITDAALPTEKRPIQPCRGCGACCSACPAEDGVCLSALTQKKGDLTDAEQAAIRSHPLAWGCDICQEVCPYTKEARAAGTLDTPIAFFREDTIPVLDRQALDCMTEAAFSTRAYAWRGRDPIRRNLILQERKE